MTLIVSFISPDLVMVATDRRLTFQTASGWQIGEDDACKLIMYGGHALVAYTGPGKLAGLNTADWITRALSSCPENCIVTAMEHLQTKLSLPIASIPSKFCHLTVVASGFAPVPGLNGYHPVRIRVSNFEMPDGTLTRPTSKFFISRICQSPGTMSLDSAGQPLVGAVRKKMLREICRPLKAGAAHRLSYPLIAREIQKVSRGCVQVGDRILVGSLLRPTAVSAIEGEGYMHLAGEDFMYFNPHSRRPLQHWPNHAAPNVAHSGLSSEILDNGYHRVTISL